MIVTVSTFPYWTDHDVAIVIFDDLHMIAYEWLNTSPASPRFPRNWIVV